ncbi:glycoside hydrolase family 15 protein [Actinotalea sp. M2MS4P-6]|uniref:glycoside hydrolase family 15 protein n=1 Tax=Actinotalea sp. M2MS4P-6 TaxID=2983762 RepID=UPI0021E4AAE1|nr:glycoside hydrolase family 15 protein [Actinotalea sp. M2MS4P-6]MCV2396239.1 glycoside hydrolase family 15 protein [Actinotalea sp. M2MS4P-6]
MGTRIEDYGLIGDLQTAALIGRDGGVDWLCLPRFDSAACFAALLDDEAAGRWRLAPAGAQVCTARRYRGDSLVLETDWETDVGAVRVIDFMPPRGEAADLVRIVEGLRGTVTMRSTLRLRFDYGHVVPWLDLEDGRATAVAGPDATVLSTPVPLERDDGDLLATFDVSEGERVPMVLTHYPSWSSVPAPVDAEDALCDTVRFWDGWIDQLSYQGRWADQVRRSLVLLKALTDDVTGGIIAAATTSLPERLGGARNWDYRFSWLRDASFTLQALLGTGYVEEARAWRAWLLRAVAGDPADLQIMYALDGARRIPETELGWLSGYEGSAPVRVGNAASDQRQLDVWGEVLEALHLARRAGVGTTDEGWAVQRALLDHLREIWREPDNGLWEMRGPQRHFVHSKVMAWVGVDRMVKAVEEHGLDGPVDEWRTLRDEIHAEVCERGFDPERGTFTQFYGSQGLDAALLLIPQVGFLPWDDPRVVGTVDAVGRELLRDGFVLRYSTDEGSEGDGLEGSEGAFLACNFWYADALWETGRTDEAVELFERLLTLANDLGLVSEEYDPSTGRQLGNTPQAFSHVGLVTTARRLSGEPTAKREHA